MRSPLLFAALLVLLASCSSPSHAADLDPNELELKTERVIIFKDGYCLVIKSGVATTDADGVAFTDEVPDAAVLGSFWAVPDEGRLVSMNAGWKVDESTESREFPCKEHVDVLVANQGKEAKVELHDKTVHTGTIHAVLVDEKFRAAGSRPVGADDGRQPAGGCPRESATRNRPGNSRLGERDAGRCRRGARAGRNAVRQHECRQQLYPPHC